MTQHLEQTSDSGQQQDPKQEFRREVWDFVKMIAWFLVLFLVLKAWVIEGYVVHGRSMQPTLDNRDHILVFKLPHVLEQWGVLDAIDPGDIVVFDSRDGSGKRYVKRVVAQGADGVTGNRVAAASGLGPGGVRVRIDEGHLYINNNLVDEPYLPGLGFDPDETSPELTLYAGEYYVLGDNRAESKDSRSFQGVADEQIIGRAVFRFWPLSGFGLLD
jgi:signal peptidase I